MNARTLVLSALVGLPLGACAARAVRQPHMDQALRLLEDAHGQLAQATADKGGHRVKAMAEVKAAIDEVNAGIAFREDKS